MGFGPWLCLPAPSASYCKAVSAKRYLSGAMLATGSTLSQRLAGSTWQRRRARYLRLVVSIFRLSRGKNLFILGASMYLSALFLVSPWLGIVQKLLDWRLLLAVVSTCCITAAGYVINDYFDVQIDRINRPGSTIIDRRISRRRALILHWLLVLAGIALAWPVSHKLCLLEGGAAGLLMLYSARLKRMAFWGNFTVAALSAISLSVVGFVYIDVSHALAVFMYFSFGSSLIREVIKDLEDIPGDRLYGCRTLPIIWGIPPTRRLLNSLLLVFGISMPLLGFYISPLLGGYMLLLLLPLGALAQRLQAADTMAAFRHLSRLSKLIMALGIVGMCLV